MRDLESQEPVDGPIVGDLPVALNVSLESGDVLSSFRGYRHVVHCDRDDRVFIRQAPEENRVVNSRMSESKILYKDPVMSLVLWYDSIPFHFRIFSISALMLTYHDAQNRRDTSHELHKPTRSQACSMLDFC